MESCHFNVKDKCVLRKSFCFICTHKIETIEGVTEMKDYINIVTTRNNTKIAMLVSVLSLLISFLTLALKVLEQPGKN